MPQLHATLVNCTLKKGPDESNTAVLLRKIASHFQQENTAIEHVRLADLNVPPGVTTEAVEKGDDFPTLYETLKATDILVIGTPIWLGHRSSLAQRLLERLDGSLSQTDQKGQMPFHNKIGACVVTGNEDGAHQICAGTLFNLTHLGFTIPPMADCYWVGPAGPGRSYVAAGGDNHLYTNKTARYLVAGCIFMANLLKQNPIDIDYSQLTKLAEAQSNSKSQEFFSD